ncbi:MAG: choice-of-anchor Q domain-containing protein, partial [Chthoniobacterales bacterium]
FGNHGSGIQLNGDYAFGGGGTITNALVERNVIFNNGSGGGGALNNEGVQDSVFRNNVLYDNHASGIVFWIGGNDAPATSSSNRNVAVNNTVIQAADGRAALQIDRGYDNVAFNNILFHPGSSARDAISITTTDTNTLSNFNIVSANFELADEDRTLAQWRSLTGNDADSTSLTAAQMQALFVNFAAHDFHLSGSNAAADSGTAAFDGKSAPGTDFAGTARPAGGGFDIGAFELVAVPEPAAAALLGIPVLWFGTRRLRR